MNITILIIVTSLQLNNVVDNILQGDVLFQQNDTQQAIDIWEQNLAQIDCEKYAEQCTDVLTRLTAAYQVNEMYTDMFATLKKTLSLVDQIKDPKRRASIYTQSSDARLFLGERLQATFQLKQPVEKVDNIPEYLSQAFWLAETSISEAKGSPKILAGALNSKGNVLTAWGKYLEPDIENAWQKYFEAVEAYRDSRLEAEKVNAKKQVITAFLNELKVKLISMMPLNEIETELKQLQSLIENDEEDWLALGIVALEVLQKDRLLTKERQNTKKLLATDRDILTPEEIKQFEEFIAEIELTEQDRQQITSLAYSALQNSLKSNISSTAYGYLGQLYEFQQRYTEALKFTNQAIFFDSTISTASSKNTDSLANNYSHLLYRWYWQKARILQKLERDLDEIIEAYRLASKNLTPVQQFLEVGYRLPMGLFQKVVRPVHYGLADVLLQKAESNPSEQEKLLIEAVDTIESVKATELQDYFKDECVVNLQAQTHSILDYEKLSISLQQELQNTAIIYPIPLPDRLVLLVSIQGIIYQKIINDITQNEIKDTAWDLRSQLQTRPHNRFLSTAQQLHNWLIKPIEDKLDNIDTLVFVPDGNLRMIPFSSLHDGKQFLIEKYAVSITPGLKLVNPQVLELNKKNKMLLVGLSESRLQHSPLPKVTDELNNIAACASSYQVTRDILLNKDFSHDKFAKYLKESMYSIVHIATHGEFSSDPKKTYLLTYQEKMQLGELQQAIGLGRFRSENPLELLTLSSCKTAVGDDRAALGLAGVAIQASARSAIATLWFVDDEATSMAMSEFYRQLLKPNVSKAKALQETQKQLIKTKRYWHPSYWAPFLLIGNWL
ncbi:CHAT domain-containing protein [Candidatus Halobeggiatoa sp. HSG11]|nr:CHAT domain-containing protein [Candidatus Halobeggiatoa sp. HSG11]